MVEVESSQVTKKSDMSGDPVSALKASNAIAVTDARLALFTRTTPDPGSPIVVVVEKVNVKATALAAEEATRALAAAALALAADAVVWSI